MQEISLITFWSGYNHVVHNVVNYFENILSAGVLTLVTLGINFLYSFD